MSPCAWSLPLPQLPALASSTNKIQHLPKTNYNIPLPPYPKKSTPFQISQNWYCKFWRIFLDFLVLESRDMLEIFSAHDIGLVKFLIFLKKNNDNWIIKCFIRPCCKNAGEKLLLICCVASGDWTGACYGASLWSMYSKALYRYIVRIRICRLRSTIDFTIIYHIA